MAQTSQILFIEPLVYIKVPKISGAVLQISDCGYYILLKKMTESWA